MQQESFPRRISAFSDVDDRRDRAAGNLFPVACKRPRDVRPKASSSPSPPAKSPFPRIALSDITNGYSTPARTPSGSFPGKRDAFVSPPACGGILDEDLLDDDFLREVDAICQEMSTSGKGERPCVEKSDWASDWCSSNGSVKAGSRLVELRGDPSSGTGSSVDGGEESGSGLVKLSEDSEELWSGLLELSGEPTSGIGGAADGGNELGSDLVELRGEPTSGIGSIVNAIEESVPGLVELSKEPNLGIRSAADGGQGSGLGRSTPSWGKEDVDGSVPLKYREYLESLNEAQREAACSDISIPLMVVAGPGSGKTSTMVGRVLTLLKEGIGPSNILAMTFTTAAASEMRDRIGAVVGKAIAKELSISTFHSFCLQLCRTHAEKLGRTPEFVIYGHGQQRRAVIEALRLVSNSKTSPTENRCQKFDELHGNDIANSFKEKSKKWQKFVTQAKASGKTPAECEIIGDDVGASILRCYDGILRSCNALDYHDFISSSVTLLTDFPDVYMECLDKWKAIVVDEFQDTSSMQYHLLKILASHKRVTIVGDEDQSIFSFNGANVCGFDSFRKDFSSHKEIRLKKNYRSTRCIVEAASALIHNNKRRCPKQLETDNTIGCKITVKECQNEAAQCAFVVDKILELRSNGSVADCSFGNVAILYRRQVSGKAFQMSFRNRKIPFNVHGVAFYRKKIIKAIMAMLRTTLPDCDDGPFRLAFKALFPGEKEEKKMVVDYVERICAARNCSFALASNDIFQAKMSGTLKRAQLTQGRKILSALEMLSKLAKRESSISMVISSAANMLPQKYLLKQRAVVDVEGGKLLNEDDDLRSVIQYLMDDVSDFLSTNFTKEDDQTKNEERGCLSILKAFIDFITLRETENFRSRRIENENSVTLTTIHQSKGLEWDTVFIVKANDNEIPLLHEFNGMVGENGTTIDEERRLLYVAITRARKRLFILYLMMDSNWQLLQPSRFLKEIPSHLFDIQGDAVLREASTQLVKDVPDALRSEPFTVKVCNQIGDEDDLSRVPEEATEMCTANSFLKRFSTEDRSMISHLFHQWAKKKSFQQPNRLLDKVNFVIDERLRNKTSKNKDVLRILKSCLKDAEAILYADSIIKWEQIPIEQRAHLVREKQEHFQKQRIEMSMGSSEATVKQIAYLQKLGCTISPTSRLHASRLIEQYKSL